MKNEIRGLQQRVKEQEHCLENRDELAKRLESRSAALVAENAEVAATLLETKQRLESEVRIRESRQAKSLLDSQDSALFKEKERQMRQEMTRLQSELDKERAKAKLNADKVMRLFYLVASHSIDRTES